MVLTRTRLRSLGLGLRFSSYDPTGRFQLPTSLSELGTPPFGLRPHKTTGQVDTTGRAPAR